MLIAMRFLLVSGGSGGHLAPLVAVGRAIEKADPSAEQLYVCSQNNDDLLFLQEEDVKYSALALPRHPLRHPLALLQSMLQAGKIIDAFKPDVVFSKGGIVSVPVCFAAHRRKILVVLHESDAVMGKANRLIAKWAATICTGFPLTNRSPLTANRSAVTGNPVRPHITDGSKPEGLRITGLKGDRPILLVIGGSQGARALNDAVAHHIDALLAHVNIIHLTGRGKRTDITRDGYWQTEFVYEELPHLYAAADMAVSRAGAGAIAELAANGIPTVLVPIEGLANNHQFLNAITAQENGGCILLLQADLDAHLPEIIADLAENPQRRQVISQNMRSLFRSDAAGQIAKIILQCVAQGGASH
jgi:UDP-N-acetylglucosamine--N-acetylmuramyl-(pentapeptide) pyrophosphoryl-undecaprenol N-acetylglucosamine transferase